MGFFLLAVAPLSAESPAERSFHLPPLTPSTALPTKPGDPVPAPVSEFSTLYLDDTGLTGAGAAVDCTPLPTVSDSNVGFIDNAIPETQVRLRYDVGYDNRRPDRAEFFYAKSGFFRQLGLDGDAQGPELPEVSVDYQELTAYLEFAMNTQVSAFLEVPYRWIDPIRNDNARDFGDLRIGFKYALQQDCDQVTTAQVRVYIPTGDAGEGLGTHHVSLEPGLLLYRRLSEALTLEAELRDWIPIEETDFADNVLCYGAGLSYLVAETETLRFSPVLELIGWTVLNGKATAVHPGTTTVVVENVDGDTIVNAALGARVNTASGDWYLGYSRALTGDTWFEDLLRVELRLVF
jgi:hypothetical protein